MNIVGLELLLTFFCLFALFAKILGIRMFVDGITATGIIGATVSFFSQRPESIVLASK